MAENQKALLAGFGKDALKELGGILSSYGIEPVEVTPDKYNYPLTAIMGDRPYFGAMPFKGPALQETLCVLHGMRGTQMENILDAFRNSKYRPDLMAVTTPTNAKWSLLALYNELCRERDNLRTRRGNL